MTSSGPGARVLSVVVTILALVDGALHFSLDLILFRGNFFGFGPPRGPPPGGGTVTPRPPGPLPPRPPLPLNELFLLNLIGYVVLVLLFWFAPRWFGWWRWLVDVAMIGYVAVVFAAWWSFGRPNPLGLGYLSKGIEIVLVLALLVHLALTFGKRAVVEAAPEKSSSEAG